MSATVKRIIREFRALSIDDQQAVARVLWGEILAAFGVA